MENIRKLLKSLEDIESDDRDAFLKISLIFLNGEWTLKTSFNDTGLYEWIWTGETLSELDEVVRRNPVE